MFPPNGFVYTLKLNVDGSIKRFKARLVARRFSKISSKDFIETFAPTVRMETLRLFLARVAKENFECSHYGTKNVFTESHLKKYINISPPKGVLVKDRYVLKALRSLYGFKQAARDWNLLCKKHLIDWRFVQSLADPCLVTHDEKGVELLVYFDDIIAAAKSAQNLNWFFEYLSSHINAKNLGEIKNILGVRVTRDRDKLTILLDQD